MGVATAAAVVGATVAVGSAVDGRNARKDAAKDVEDANIQSATQLAEAGRLGAADVRTGGKAARVDVNRGANDALSIIDPYAARGNAYYDRYKDRALSNSNGGDALANSVRSASINGVNKNIYDTSRVVDREIKRQGGITASGIMPEYQSMILDQAKKGYQANSDRSRIENTRYGTLARIAAGEGAQIASALVGQGPALQQLGQGAEEARLMSDVASRNFTSGLAQTAATQIGKRFG
tara:strand:+ start:1335 stop:2045 length:711 start_codon:yes stop_codon:yes gene_type:complete